MGICQQVFVWASARPFIKAFTLFVLFFQSEIQMSVFQTVSIGGVQRNQPVQRQHHTKADLQYYLRQAAISEHFAVVHLVKTHTKGARSIYSSGQ